MSDKYNLSILSIYLGKKNNISSKYKIYYNYKRIKIML